MAGEQLELRGTKPAAAMKLLVDENVPASVTRFFAARQHEIIQVREVFGAGTIDPMVAIGGDKLGAIILSWDKDFKRLVTRRRTEGGQPYLRKLGRIIFSCNEARGAQRAADAIEHIDLEFRVVQQRRDRRMIVEIGETRISFIR